jgi:hypothetical protein
MIRSSLYDPSIETKHLAKAGAIIAAQQLKAAVPLTAATAADPAISAFLQDLAMLQTEILIGKPEELRTIIHYVDATFPEFRQFLSLSKRSNARKTFPRRALLQNLADYLLDIYNYDAFTTKGAGWNGYRLVGTFGLRICPYCQLNHINFHEDAAFQMRPALDHFYPESLYPFLAISLYNLVPSCHQCNSSIKSNHDPLAVELCPPFETIPNRIQFRLDNLPHNATDLDPHDVQLTIECATGQHHAQRHIDFFRLAERYQWYGPEIRDLFSRCVSYMDAGEEIKNLINPTEFTCGFRDNDKDARMLGHCSVQLSAQILSAIAV